MDERHQQRLLADLNSDDESVRNWAVQQFWQAWFSQKGQVGLERLLHSQELMQQGQVDDANAMLTAVIEAQPDFAEAWNRRAVLHYTQQQYDRAIADCKQVITLIPVHFGAWSGMGLCHMALGEYREALAAFRQAANLQPHAIEHRRAILECTSRLGQ